MTHLVMTHIVAVLTDPGTVDICLDAAAVAAASVPASAIEALHPRPRCEGMVPPAEGEMTPARHAELVALLDRRSQDIRAALRAWIAAHPASEAPSWNEVEGRSVEAIVTQRGKVADLIVLMRPAEREGEEALHAGIFDTGCLLLIVPPLAAAVRSFGRHMAIAWQPGDPVVVRAVLASLPWLSKAERVSLLLAGHDGTLPAPPDDAIALLAGYGISVAAVVEMRGVESIGSLLLREAHAIGADCLVMGAHYHRRLFGTTLGETTRYMLDAVDLPVYLTHAGDASGYPDHPGGP
jgi:nucleotide-binding universal stress UspA family protein